MWQRSSVRLNLKLQETENKANYLICVGIWEKTHLKHTDWSTANTSWVCFGRTRESDEGNNTDYLLHILHTQVRIHALENKKKPGGSRCMKTLCEKGQWEKLRLKDNNHVTSMWLVFFSEVPQTEKQGRGLWEAHSYILKNRPPFIRVAALLLVALRSVGVRKMA